MSDDQAQDNFDRVLSIQERTVEALSKVYSQLDMQDDAMKCISAEMKELSNLIRQKHCVTEKAVFTQLESTFRAEHVQRSSEHKTILGAITDQVVPHMEVIKTKDAQLTDWMKLATLIVSVVSIALGLAIWLKK
jgi:hypothetical protein